MKEFKSIIKNILFSFLSKEKGYSDLKVLTGQAQGVTLRVDMRKEGSYFLGTYDKWIFDKIKFSNYIKPGMIVWDCGAYIGYYSAVFRKCIGETGSIWTFEASTKNYNVVKEVPTLNKWKNVHVLNLAVGPENSFIKFANNLGGSNGPVGLSKEYNDQDELEVIEVECRGVDEIIELKKAKTPDFIKFDLESAEVFALHNGDKLFKEKKPILLLEIHGEEAFESAGRFLEKYAYEAAYVGDFPSPKNWYSTNDDLQKIGFIPHMLFCQPRSI
jgi:FkbM family methyltransferase